MGCFPLLFPKSCTVFLGINNDNATEVELGNGTSHSNKMIENLKKAKRSWYNNIRQISFVLSYSQESWNKKAVLKLSSSKQLHDQLRLVAWEKQKKATAREVLRKPKNGVVLWPQLTLLYHIVGSSACFYSSDITRQRYYMRTAC